MRYCAECGNPVSSDAQFCPTCGKNVLAAKRFCTECGAALSPGAEFCASCGAVRKHPSADKSHRANKPAFLYTLTSALRKVKRSTKIAVIGVLVAALAIGLVFALLPGDARTPAGVTGIFELGPDSQIADAMVGTDGGMIQVQDEVSALVGMTISVPQGAYAEPVAFTISEKMIVSSTFGEDFTPVTPLISVDNGEVFAEQPLEVTIPIDMEDDEFAMGFYYDAATGALEGIPFSELTNDSITLVTRHFSDLIILRIKQGRLLGRITSGIDSGFRPGHDDFNTDNYGSIIAPRGYCRGQNMAEMYYYIYMKDQSQGGAELYGRFDNDGLEPATPELWQDDARAIRLSSALQRLYVHALHEETLGDDEYWEFYNKGNDEQTFHALAYSMMASGRPQLLSICNKDFTSGHSLIAYKVEDDTVYVADPNFTGKEKKLILYRGAIPGSDWRARFYDYYSAQNAAQAKANGESPYTEFEWLGNSALCNLHATGLSWQSALGDGGVVDAFFPADPEITVCRGMKEDPLYGAVLDEVPISDGLTVNLTMLDELAVNGGGRLYYRYVSPEVTADQGLLFYLNGEWQEGLGQPGMPEDYRYIQLRPGENKVGILYMIWYTDSKYNPNDPQSVDGSGWQYANFYRYTIYYDDGATEVTTTLATGGTTSETTPEVVQAPYSVVAGAWVREEDRYEEWNPPRLTFSDLGWAAVSKDGIYQYTGTYHVYESGDGYRIVVEEIMDAEGGMIDDVICTLGADSSSMHVDYDPGYVYVRSEAGF